jgi:hypothetical protein
MSRFKSALLAATILLGAGGIAFAQPKPTYDPAQLPAITGKVAQYLLGPRGDVDGLMLADGTEVHVSPGLSSELVFTVKPGDAITIHGLKAKAVPMVAAASITNDASGVTIAGRMGHAMHGGGASIEAQGVVKAALHEPHGEINGVLLEDGTVVRLPPPEARKLAAQLAIGQKLFARGTGVKSPLGEVIMASQIGPDATKLTDIAMPHWRGGEGMGGMPGHHMMGGHPAPNGAPPAPQ